MIAIEGISPAFILAACLRYDMAPIPVTFEAQVRLTNETAQVVQDGALIRVNEIPFRIIKCEPLRNAGGSVQGDMPLSAVAITAFPDSLVGVARRRRAAVIGKNASFSTLYRACGATVSVEGDISVGRFACFKGDVPTAQIAKVLQEESAVLVWKAGRVALVRLRDLMAQKPISGLSVTASEDVQSDFLESDEIPQYVSTGPDGSFLIAERRNEAQAVAYTPRKTSRELGLMGRVLVRRKVVTGNPNLEVQAGAVLDVRGVPMAVMTAVHYMQNGTDGGDVAQYSRYWLGSLK
jgi:hypothetical protein